LSGARFRLSLLLRVVSCDDSDRRRPRRAPSIRSCGGSVSKCTARKLFNPLPSLLAPPDHFLWSPYGIGQTVIFLPCGYFFLFSSHNLSRRRLDVCHTSTYGVALVRISDAGLKPAACGSLKTQDAKSRQKSPSGQHRTTLSGYIFATKARIGNQKQNL